jgi:periplasmic divalent cation tolerance protein
MKPAGKENNQPDVMLVLSTCPPDAAASLAEMLVSARLAACVNILPAVTSIYRWQGRLENATESLMVIKCAAENYAALEQRLRRAHPYELPEIVTVPNIGGLPEYLQWVSNPGPS